MHPRLEELFAYAAETRAELVATVREMPDDAIRRRPAENRWSAAEHLEHLALVEAGSARIAARLLAKAKAAGLGPERESGSVMHSLDRFGLAEGRMPMAAPGFVTPRGVPTAEESLQQLAASREALIQIGRDGDGFDLGAVKLQHAALGELDLYQWILFLAQHERRHARQIARQST